MMSTLAMSRAVSLAAAVGLALAACGSSDSGSDDASSAPVEASAAETDAPESEAESEAAPAEEDVLGAPDPASGEPLKFGFLNLEAGPVTFPEGTAGAQAAVSYINEYRGGIGGRPIELITCPTDGQPATSERCANQVLDEDPVAIIGGADTGAPGAFAVWERANLAYIGGLPFTPFENSSPISIQFVTVSSGDNAAAAVYAVETLGVKKVSVIYTDDSQGVLSATKVVEPTFKALGLSDIQLVPVPPTAPDVSAQAAAAASSNPDLIYIISPNACANVLLALQTVGYTGELMGTALCAIPPVIEAAGAAADGLYSAGPLEPLYSPNPDAVLFQAAMKKYAPADTLIADPSAIPFLSVMNLEAVLDDIPAEELTTETILAAFREGTDVPNFLAHPYTCDGTALTKAPAVCNAYQRMYQVVGDHSEPIGGPDDWVTASGFFEG